MKTTQTKSWLLARAAMVALLLGVTTQAKAWGYFSFPDFDIAPGETKEVAIQFEDNKDVDYVAFQFDLYLPEGLTIVKQENGKPDLRFNEERKDDHTFSSATQTDGALRVFGISLTNSSFRGTSGDFVYITVTAADDFDGSHEVKLKKILYSTAQGDRTEQGEVVATATARHWTFNAETGHLFVNDDYDYAPWESHKADIKTVEFGSRVTSVYAWAFGNCPSLTDITIPEDVTSIGDYAFYDCSSLTNITIPESVSDIGNGAFQGCSSLSNITIPEESKLTSIGDYAFHDCSSLINITIPESVSGIGNGAFNGCTSLTSVTIPSGVTLIEEAAFHYCTSLESVTFPDGLISIGNSAFWGCQELSNITIPDGVTTIGDHAFSYCYKFSEITIPASMTDIEEGAFFDCHNLKTVINLSGLGIVAHSKDYGYVAYYADKVWTPGVHLDCTERGLLIGDQFTLEATVIPAGPSVTWSTSKTSVATVDNNGLVTGVGEGTAVITATAGSYSATCTVTVSKKVIPVTSVELNQTSATIIIGNTLTLEATVTPGDATDKTVTWTSSNTAVATVDDNGMVTAKAAGTATITATASGYPATCVVTVEEPVVESGEYYLYNVGTKKFLSRGEYWGTHATVDSYGIPFVWTAEEYSLKFLDSNVYLFETDDNNVYTDNSSTGFEFERAEEGYLLKSQKSDRYLTIGDKIFTHQMVNLTDDAALATLWQPMTKAEHDAIVAGYVEENYTSVIAAAGITATAGDFASYLATLNAVDMTSAIGTARFAGNAGSWNFTEVRHQDWQPAYGTDFCEMWQATGHYAQTITDLPEGIYKVTMQGFERSGGVAQCFALGERGYEITTATLGANGEEINLKSWYSDRGGESDPNSTAAAVNAFNSGKYMNEIYTYVGEDGTLTITVNKPSHVGDNWVIFNNFVLIHYADVAVSGITLDQNTATLTEGDIMYLTATVSPDNATDKTVTWSSSNTAVATVDNNGMVTAKVAGKATITATAGGHSATCVVTVEKKVIPVSDITINPETATLTEGDIMGLTATVSPDNATDKTVIWSSDNTAVATVDNNGMVTAKVAGTATITATAGGHSATCVVTVEPELKGIASINELSNTKLYLVAQLKRDKTSWAVAVGGNAMKSNEDLRIDMNTEDSRQHFALIKHNDEFYLYHAAEKKFVSKDGSLSVQPVDAINITESTAFAGTFVMYFDDMHYINVDGNGYMAVNDWTDHDGGNSCTIVPVGDFDPTDALKAFVVEVSGITLSQNTATLTEGKTLTLTVAVSPDNATDKTVTWTSSNTTVATVDNNGKVTAKVAGTATITATAGGYSATCVVTVEEEVIAVSGITISQETAALTIGETLALTAVVSPANATDKTVAWSSNNTAVATVDSNGVVTAVAAGTATISARIGSKRAVCRVTVESEDTGIGQLTIDKSQLIIYDLTGRRVFNVDELKGMYIVNGKKVIFK